MMHSTAQKQRQLYEYQKFIDVAVFIPAYKPHSNLHEKVCGLQELQKFMTYLIMSFNGFYINFSS